MLILTRKIHQNIVIGDEVIVKILGINGNAVRMAIHAPTNITVHREEIYKKIKMQEIEKWGGDTRELHKYYEILNFLS